MYKAPNPFQKQNQLEKKHFPSLKDVKKFRFFATNLKNSLYSIFYFASIRYTVQHLHGSGSVHFGLDPDPLTKQMKGCKMYTVHSGGG